MNKKDMALLAAAGFVCSGLALSPVSAEAPKTIAKVPGGACPVTGKCSKGPKFFKSMTDEQLEKLSSLKNEMRESMGPKILELKKLKSQMKDKLTKEDVNKDEILAIQAKINTVKSDISNVKVAFMVDASSVLTAEQKKEMRRKMLMKNIMGKRHGKKRFHGKKFHGKRFKKGKLGAEADKSVTTEAPSVESEKTLG